MGKRGPKSFKPNWEQVDQMCAIQCTGVEMADILDVNYSTFERACKREKKMKLADYIQQKAQVGKMSLRRKQYTLAIEGNATMLVWLGKNWLNQTDKQEIDQTVKGELNGEVIYKPIIKRFDGSLDEEDESE